MILISLLLVYQCPQRKIPRAVQNDNALVPIWYRFSLLFPHLLSYISPNKFTTNNLDLTLVQYGIQNFFNSKFHIANSIHEEIFGRNLTTAPVPDDNATIYSNKTATDEAVRKSGLPWIANYFSLSALTGDGVSESDLSEFLKQVNTIIFANTLIFIFALFLLYFILFILFQNKCWKPRKFRYRNECPMIIYGLLAITTLFLYYFGIINSTKGLLRNIDEIGCIAQYLPELGSAVTDGLKKFINANAKITNDLLDNYTNYTTEFNSSYNTAKTNLQEKLIKFEEKYKQMIDYGGRIYRFNNQIGYIHYLSPNSVKTIFKIVVDQNSKGQFVIDGSNHFINGAQSSLDNSYRINELSEMLSNLSSTEKLYLGEHPISYYINMSEDNLTSEYLFEGISDTFEFIYILMLILLLITAAVLLPQILVLERNNKCTRCLAIAPTILPSILIFVYIVLLLLLHIVGTVFYSVSSSYDPLVAKIVTTGLANMGISNITIPPINLSLISGNLYDDCIQFDPITIGDITANALKNMRYADYASSLSDAIGLREIRKPVNVENSFEKTLNDFANNLKFGKNSTHYNDNMTTILHKLRYDDSLKGFADYDFIKAINEYMETLSEEEKLKIEYYVRRAKRRWNPGYSDNLHIYEEAEDLFQAFEEAKIAFINASTALIRNITILLPGVVSNIANLPDYFDNIVIAGILNYIYNYLFVDLGNNIYALDFMLHITIILLIIMTFITLYRRKEMASRFYLDKIDPGYRAHRHVHQEECLDNDTNILISFKDKLSYEIQ